MRALKFIWRGIWHYRLSYSGVGAGAVLGAMVLLGALIAGDSVKETLSEVARQRVGQVDHVFAAGEGFFRDALAADVSRTRSVATGAAQLSFQWPGIGECSDSGGGRSVLGVFA